MKNNDPKATIKLRETFAPPEPDEVKELSESDFDGVMDTIFEFLLVENKVSPNDLLSIACTLVSFVVAHGYISIPDIRSFLNEAIEVSVLIQQEPIGEA